MARLGGLDAKMPDTHERLDYLLSWRPGPTDMVCSQLDPAPVLERLSSGSAMCACHSNHFDTMLKGVEMPAAGPEGLRIWVALSRQTTEE